MTKMISCRLPSANSFLLSIIVAALFYVAVPAPEAEAMEPVTIALLTPVAIETARLAAPYVIAGLRNIGLAMIDLGVDLIGFFRLPIGLFEITILAPFGFFSEGVLDIWEGTRSLGGFVFKCMFLPLKPLSPWAGGLG